MSTIKKRSSQKTKTLCISLILLFSFDLLAQSQDVVIARNSVYAEGTSHGAYYSINYDRIFRLGANFTNTYRVGFSLLNNAIALPVGLNFLKGDGFHHFEFGLTIMPYVENYQKFFSAGSLSDKKIYIIPGAGYRYQPPAGGFFFKAIVAPVIFLDPPSDNFWKMDGKVYAGGSVGAGISF
ncbi:MAG TPA: hypothetical protein PLB49_10900 [Chitinophagaceae bacterium]|nr:hypothetical protein [Chitinophagaceae bacterium]HPH32354.1 hypothetical protein [Chitinophagaceae bacterium]